MQRWFTTALAAGLMKIGTNLSGTDSGAARVNTTPAPISVPLSAHRCRAALV